MEADVLQEGVTKTVDEFGSGSLEEYSNTPQTNNE